LIIINIEVLGVWHYMQLRLGTLAAEDREGWRATKRRGMP